MTVVFDYDDIIINESGIEYDEEIKIPADQITPEVLEFCKAVSSRIEQLKSTINYLMASDSLDGDYCEGDEN